MHSFEPFRVVGSICDSVPISFTYLYGEPILMVATGRTFQLYKGISLRMVRGGPTFQQPIRAVAQTGKFRCVAEGPRVHVMSHHKLLWTAMLEPVTQPDILLLLAQDDLLFVLGSNKHIVIYDIKTGVIQREIRVEASESITSWCLLSGYTNKLLVATEEGNLHLYNYRKGTCLWKSQKSKSSPILSLCASVYKDIVAFGTGDGRVVCFNVAEDQIITEFSHAAGAVTAIIFRIDKDGFLVSGTSLGEVVVWDIENRCMDGILTRSKQVRTEAEVRDTPHQRPVHSLVVFPPPPSTSQVPASSAEKAAPLLVSAGSDNALIQFRFDTVDGLGLLARERRGHASSCTVATFFNSDLLITAGTDQALRVTHVFSDRASWELSQGKLGKRGRETRQGREALQMPPATAIASSTIRNYQWSSVVTLHESSAITCGWRMDNRALEFKLSGIKTTSHTARCISISDCGNYAVVGYSSGHATMMNIQNRSVRQLFDPMWGGENESVSDLRCHESAVETIQVANDNSTIITAGLDGMIKFWDLPSGNWRRTIATHIPITKSCLHPVSSLFLAVHHHRIDVYHGNPNLELDSSVFATPVRSLVGHTSAITALAISPDAFRYVVSTSSDAVLLLWDIAAAACVGQYRFNSPATSVAFHPDALFMVTTHADERGAFLWCNNLRYGFVPEVILRPEQRPLDSIPLLAYPKSHGAREDVEEEDASRHCQEAAEEGEFSLQKSSVNDSESNIPLYEASKDLAQLQRQKERKQWEELNNIRTEGLQLSRTLSRQTWFELTVLDQIKEKNQPLLPQKKKALPFFLATTEEVRPTFLVVASSSTSPSAVGSGPTKLVGEDAGAFSRFQKLLVARDHEAIMEYLTRSRHATPQAIDLEIKQAIQYVSGTEYEEVELNQMKECLYGLLEFILFWLKKGEEADFIQGVLSNVLRTHFALIGYLGKDCVPLLEAIAEEQNRTRYTMDHLVSFPSCLAGTLSGTLF